MVSVKNEINDILLNTVSDLESRLDESRNVLSDIQTKMDSKVSEAKGYKVSVDDSKENIKRLEDEIKSLESDLIELKPAEIRSAIPVERGTVTITRINVFFKACKK